MENPKVQHTQVPRFLIPLNVATKAKREAGIGIERLQNMVRLSARCTHPDGNRRYEDMIFMVQGRRVTSVTVLPTLKLVEPVEPAAHYQCQTCQDKNKVQVFDQCEHCDGLGCPRCDKGLVPSSIACPECDRIRRFGGRRH